MDALLKKAHEVGLVQIEEEIAKLARFVAGIQPVHVLEIGTNHGGSFYLWSQLATGKKISVDLCEGPFGNDVLPDDCVALEKEMRSWAPDVHVIRGDSHDVDVVLKVEAVLDGDLLDFLFIDGDHSLNGVMDDYYNYGRFVKKGGWIAFHDVNDTEFHRWCGCYVGQFWVTLEGHKIEFNEHSHWGGIGLIQKA